MKRLIFTNVHAFDIHYILVDYILNIKSFYQEGDKVIVCFWDVEMYNQHLDEYSSYLDSRTKVREITSEISKLLSCLGISHTIIYLSDGLRRINMDDRIFSTLLSCYQSVRFKDVSSFYNESKYLDVGETTIGKINFMITSFVMAVFFKELYSSISKGKNPTVFYTGERFLAVKKRLCNAILDEDPAKVFPELELWKTLPILNYKKKDWISMSMKREDIYKIVSEYFTEDKDMLKDLVSIGLRTEHDVLAHEVKEIYKLIDNKVKKEVLVGRVTDFFIHFFAYIRELTQKPGAGDIKKIKYINDPNGYRHVTESITPVKMEILKYCDGTHLISDIVRKVKVKESSVRSYISRMKKEKLISDDKRPMRAMDEIVINFD